MLLLHLLQLSRIRRLQNVIVTFVTCYSYLGSEGSRMLLLHVLHVTCYSYLGSEGSRMLLLHVLHVTVI